MSEETLSTVLHEAHSFEPSDELAAAANGKAELYAAADADYEAFWAEQARRYVTWGKDFDTTLDWSGVLDGGMKADCFLTEAASKVGLGVWAEPLTARLITTRDNQPLWSRLVIRPPVFSRVELMRF